MTTDANLIAVEQALLQNDVAAKCAAVAAIDRTAAATALSAEREGVACTVPGRPSRPTLVHPRDVPRRAMNTTEGRIALAHAVAHIEFNAINLALDAALRFPGLPRSYYRDWLRVADDEARHFSLLRGWLRDHGADYGDCEAHNGLWEAAEQTAHDPLARMALVPRVLEARGLDVTPGMIERLRQVREAALVAVLETILREEVAHVAIGTRWYRYLCDQRGVEPVAMFRALLREHRVSLRAPLNIDARRCAGFVDAELVDCLG